MTRNIFEYISRISVACHAEMVNRSETKRQSYIIEGLMGEGYITISKKRFEQRISYGLMTPVFCLFCNSVSSWDGCGVIQCHIWDRHGRTNFSKQFAQRVFLLMHAYANEYETWSITIL